jgi:hypothetical protein
MKIRSTVTTLGAALALTIILAAGATPAHAAKEKNGQSKPSTVVESPLTVVESKHANADPRAMNIGSNGSRSKDDPYQQGSTYQAFDPNQPYEPPKPSSSNNAPESANQQGPESSNSPSSSTGLASGSIVPSTTPGSIGPSFQQVQGAVVPNSNTTAAYQAVPGVQTPSGSIYPGSHGSMFPANGATTPSQQSPGASVIPTGGNPAYPRSSNASSVPINTNATNQQTPGAPPITGGTGASSPQTSTTFVASPGGTSSSQQAPGAGSQQSSAAMVSSTARADVRVVYVNSATNNSSTLFHFRIDNAGSEPATAITLSSAVREQSNTSSAARKVDEQYAPIASLAPGQSQDLVVTCTPQPGSRCVSASVEASAANDVNPANNGASSVGQSH